MATKTILLDVGGTFIKCSDGREIPINSDGSREEITASLRQAVYGGQFVPEKVAVAIPGPFDYASGSFRMKHKFAAVYGERFADLVMEESLTGGQTISFRFIHDVNCMLLGEMTSGAGRDYRRVALVTLGTGLGFSMSLDGEIICNEMGSPKVSIFSRPYRDGILEDYASKRGFLRGYEGITVKELAETARKGNGKAAERFAEVGGIIAGSIRPILEEYGIECLLFGGQISYNFDLFGPSVQKGLEGLSSLRKISPVSDISKATFNGLRHLLSIS